MNDLKKPVFRMLSGLPGSGKSTHAQTLENFKIHSSDLLRKELYGDENNQENNNELFLELHRRIKEDLRRGHNVCYDATNLNKKRRIAFLNELKNIHCYKECILVLTPYEKCLKQNKMRKRYVPEDVIKRMYTNFNPPHYSEGWDSIGICLQLDGDEWENYDVNKLFNGENGIDYFNQENSHHMLTLGWHCRKACEYIQEKYPEKKSVAVAALLHDIGKVFTKSELNAKGENDGECHYYQHHCVGAYDCLFYLMLSGLSAEQSLYISNLIYYHMHPYMGWRQSKSVERRTRIQIGEEMFEDIMALHEADVAAH